ncbi:hypothetical protein, partial [Salmonella sp. s51228]|uniref:hypothetical protein n=1 Tax=Salmonella sp. s51228 TaxID=3159652 RepID=UPI00397FEA82
KDGNNITISVSYIDAISGGAQKMSFFIPLMDPATDPALNKAIVLTHFVDLHNDYIHDKKGVIHLERFVSFKNHFEDEMEKLNDKSLSTTNKAYMEMIDKIIQIEKVAQKPSTS